MLRLLRSAFRVRMRVHGRARVLEIAVVWSLADVHRASELLRLRD